MLTTSPARSARHMSSFVVRASTRTISPSRKIWPDLGSTHQTSLPTVGFDATTTLKRSDFGLGRYVPQVGDPIQLHLTSQAVEAKAYVEYLKAQAAKIAPEAVEAGASGAALRGAEKDSDHVESEQSRTTMGAQFTED